MVMKRLVLPGNTLVLDYDSSEETDDHAMRIGDGYTWGGGDDMTGDVVTAIRWNSGTLEYKYRTLTIADGVVTNVGTESSWTTVP